MWDVICRKESAICRADSRPTFSLSRQEEVGTGLELASVEPPRKQGYSCAEGRFRQVHTLALLIKLKARLAVFSLLLSEGPRVAEAGADVCNLAKMVSIVH